VPSISANRKVNEAVFAAFAPRSEKYRKPLRQFMDMMESAKFRPVTFVGQRLWDEHVRAFDQATHHRETHETAQQAMTDGTRVVQRELDKAFARLRYPVLDPRIPIAIAGVCALAVVGLVVWRVRLILRMGRVTRSEAWAGYFFVSPWLFGFLALTAGPIVTSIFLSFCDYDVLHSPRFVGAHNYIELLGEDRYYLTKSLGNVAYLAGIGIPLGIVTGLAIAMLLNAKVGGMSVYRTCFYIPSIVPVIASAVLWAWVLNGDPNRGLLNAAWKMTLTAWFGIDPPGWFGAAEWAKPGLIIQGLWGAGGGMILWLAGLQGIPQHLYEAADIDGAGWWVKFRHVTLPMLSPYVFFNLIMGTIGALQEFDRVYVLSGQGGGGSSVGPVDSLLVPVMVLFNNAFKYFKMGYASALAWVLFVIILALTLVQLKLAPRWVHYEAEKK
jgi:multiple sugar transport system permease protein